VSQSVTINTAGKIPDSTTVKAYLMTQVPEKKRAPFGAAVAEGSTSAGSLSLTALPDNIQLQLAYEETGKWFYPMTITTQAAKTGGLSEVASAENLTLPNGSVVKVNGAAEVKKIAPAAPGTVVVLIITGTAKLLDGENLKLSAAGPVTADDTITLACDGTNWYETGRSVN